MLAAHARATTKGGALGKVESDRVRGIVSRAFFILESFCHDRGNGQRQAEHREHNGYGGANLVR